MKVVEVKQSLLALAFLLMPLTFIFGQDKEPEKEVNRKDKIEQLKIAFITKELDLTPEESEKFWPIYNEMSKKLREEKKSEKKLHKEIKEGEDLTDSDISAKMDQIFEHEQNLLDLKKEYHEKIADVIGQKKAVKLLSLEQRFKRELLDQIKDRPEDGRGPRPDGRPHPRPDMKK